MSYAQLLAEDRRLSLLISLAHAPAYQASFMVLQEQVRVFGHNASAEQVRIDMAWLETQGLVRIEVLRSAGGEVSLGTITGTGLDVAEARTTIPGVKRPLPPL